MVESPETIAGVLGAFVNGQLEANRVMAKGILRNHRSIVFLVVAGAIIGIHTYKNHKRIKALEYRVATLEDETQFTE